MKFQWLKQQASNQNVIVIFSGWAFTAEVFAHLQQINDGYDVLFVSDYRDLNIDLPDLQKYQQRYLLAWSFGVASFGAWRQQQKNMPNFDRMVAINGTMQPIDRLYGIPESVLQKTMNTLSEQSFQVFAKRCFLPKFLSEHLVIHVADRVQELQIILQREHPIISGWDLVWVSTQDKIFPTKNVLRAWQAYNQGSSKHAVIIECEALHAPFHLWSSWDDVIKPI